MSSLAENKLQASSFALLWGRLYQGRIVPITTVVVCIILLWYAGAVWLNKPLLIDQYERQNISWDLSRLLRDAWSMERPILPAPDQVIVEMNKTIFGKNISSKRSLVYHSWVTLSSTLLGFVIGGVLGILLAVGIVHVRALERSLLPWVITSQTIPILAIAPMIIVVLAAVGFVGLLPKAIISAYLCFFPFTISMVKGLRSPDPLAKDLMRTYSASNWDVFWKLRFPASVPFLFSAMKVGIAISLVGAIVGELPTGAQAGIGARLLAGSYYGQTIQIWSALVTASILAGSLVALVSVAERLTMRKMGVRT
jgi:NitT/TauT family transport system permease protein|tara:strand:- start:4044 stop:4973 length:930 start_codon:yes stop_codon:yes gene_type:complete